VTGGNERTELGLSSAVLPLIAGDSADMIWNKAR
jgi:hypothetical protein